MPPSKKQGGQQQQRANGRGQAAPKKAAGSDWTPAATKDGVAAPTAAPAAPPAAPATVEVPAPPTAAAPPAAPSSQDIPFFDADEKEATASVPDGVEVEAWKTAMSLPVPTEAEVAQPEMTPPTATPADEDEEFVDAREACEEPVKDKKVEEEEEAAEDFSDPLALLGGMGQEEVYKVTLVEEVAPAPPKEEEPEQPAPAEEQAAPAAEEAVAPHKEEEEPERPAPAEEAAPPPPAEPAETAAAEVAAPVEAAPAPPTQAEAEPAAPPPAEAATLVEAEAEAPAAAPPAPAAAPEAVKEVPAQPAIEGAGSDTEGGRTACNSSVGSLSDLSCSDQHSRCHISAVCACTKPGECLAIVGGDDALGAWDVKRAVKLSTSGDSFPTWSADIAHAPAAGSDFKLIILRSDGGVAWEPIDGNRSWPAGGSAGILGTYGKR